MPVKYLFGRRVAAGGFAAYESIILMKRRNDKIIYFYSCSSRVYTDTLCVCVYVCIYMEDLGTFDVKADQTATGIEDF